MLCKLECYGFVVIDWYLDDYLGFVSWACVDLCGGADHVNFRSLWTSLVAGVVDSDMLYEIHSLRTFN